MLMRTWPYGTTKRATVLKVDQSVMHGRVVKVITLKDDEGEGHILVERRQFPQLLLAAWQVANEEISALFELADILQSIGHHAASGRRDVDPDRVSQTPDVKAGDAGQLVFTRGGPAGGYFKFTRDDMATERRA